jgi:hypothetical protein
MLMNTLPAPSACPVSAIPVSGMVARTAPVLAPMANDAIGGRIDDHDLGAVGHVGALA